MIAENVHIDWNQNTLGVDHRASLKETNGRSHIDENDIVVLLVIDEQVTEQKRAPWQADCLCFSINREAVWRLSSKSSSFCS